MLNFIYYFIIYINVIYFMFMINNQAKKRSDKKKTELVYYIGVYVHELCIDILIRCIDFKIIFE